MSYLTTSHATYGLSFAGREGWEVIVEEEALATLVKHVVKNLFVKLGAECHSGE